MSDDDSTNQSEDDTTMVPGGLSSATLAKMNRKAGTWFSWIVTTGICIIGVMLLISIFPVSMCASKERANRVKCASNLRQFGQALQLYYADNKCWPRTRYDPIKPLGNGFSGASAADPFAADGPAANDPTAAMFLLVKTTDLNEEVFVCPSSNQEKDTFTVGNTTYIRAQRSNFTSPNNLSYSFTNMYADTAAVARGYKWDPSVSADFAIAADRSDGETTKTIGLTSASVQSDQRSMNSRNHEQDGQNVLYADGHVDWYQSAWAGLKKDNIYTSAALDAGGNQLDPAASVPLWPSPQSPTDTVLVPRRGNGF